MILLFYQSALNPIKITNTIAGETTLNLDVSTTLLYCLLNASIEKTFILCSSDVGSSKISIDLKILDSSTKSKYIWHPIRDVKKLIQAEV